MANPSAGTANPSAGTATRTACATPAAGGGPLAQTDAGGAGAVLVYTTLPDVKAAEALAETLIGAHLVACANILPGMVSLYRWEGTIERASEVVMILKTRADLAPAVTTEVAARHPYECPAVLVVPVSCGLAGYLDWIAAATEGSRR